MLYLTKTYGIGSELRFNNRATVFAQPSAKFVSVKGNRAGVTFPQGGELPGPLFGTEPRGCLPCSRPCGELLGVGTVCTQLHTANPACAAPQVMPTRMCCRTCLASPTSASASLAPTWQPCSCRQGLCLSPHALQAALPTPRLRSQRLLTLVCVQCGACHYTTQPGPSGCTLPQPHLTNCVCECLIQLSNPSQTLTSCGDAIRLEITPGDDVSTCLDNTIWFDTIRNSRIGTAGGGAVH